MMEDEMLHYVPVNSPLTGFCNDEIFEVDGMGVEKADFNAFILEQYGYNEYDVERLGYDLIVRMINRR
jgi:hypothetical protein